MAERIKNALVHENPIGDADVLLEGSPESAGCRALGTPMKPDTSANPNDLRFISRPPLFKYADLPWHTSESSGTNPRT